jgi:hypothetical protein
MVLAAILPGSTHLTRNPGSCRWLICFERSHFCDFVKFGRLVSEKIVKSSLLVDLFYIGVLDISKEWSMLPINFVNPLQIYLKWSPNLRKLAN